MNPDNIEQLLDRYLNGTASAGEQAVVEQWLTRYQNPDSEWGKMDKQSKSLWLGKLQAEVSGTVRRETPVRRIYPVRRWMAVAAILLVVLFAGLLTADKFSEPRQQLAIMQVSENRKQKIELADGSVVWVNAGSSLRYPKEFSGNTREVYLDGEAYFDVKHNPEKTFIVHTGQVRTTVLGTAFNISTGKQSHEITVTVTRGKVRVSDGKRILAVLTPDQQLHYNTGNGQTLAQMVNAAQVAGWKDELRFNNITFGEAAIELEERFHVSIRFANERVRACRFSGSAPESNDLDAVLKVLCEFNRSTYTRKADGSIWIDGKGCSP
ncbi:FecR family protein [Sediminibacterium ginsengisoli]|uniref:Ferric-dicitrate binding protein FerR, regulates iron transport through sigma-19 n=1 Tax=Sediminibacterium ginsengisoli TaxID=413434 RepID=A0A1T4KTG7_9BACT|nr:FecR domain-containing protein [Sediminibacterium ginsengisoli]SJZ45683.1 ferric-dicitrate binding protein FerR, regulates iron transport through sigma-19 [Sediminibacterium ginsengisoli]